MGTKLDKRILSYLEDKLGLAEQTIKNKISAIRRKNPNLPINGAAHVLAVQYGYSVLRMLSKEDKQQVSAIQVKKPAIKVKKKNPRTQKKKKPLIEYEADDYFVRGHIDEFNKSFNSGTFTASHILARKIIENLIREILSNKFPGNSLTSRNLYFDTAQNRFRDFSVILRNLYDKRNEFSPEKSKMIKRL